MVKFSRYRCFEADGSQRLGTFTAQHYHELTQTYPHVELSQQRYEAYPLERCDALELIERWNREANYGGFRRCFVLEI